MALTFTLIKTLIGVNSNIFTLSPIFVVTAKRLQHRAFIFILTQKTSFLEKGKAKIG